MKGVVLCDVELTRLWDCKSVPAKLSAGVRTKNTCHGRFLFSVVYKYENDLTLHTWLQWNKNIIFKTTRQTGSKSRCVTCPVLKFGAIVLKLYFVFAEFLSYGYGQPSYCGTNCKFLSDGFGHWINGTFVPHAPGGSLKKSWTLKNEVNTGAKLCSLWYRFKK